VDTVTIDRQFFDYLTGMQKQIQQNQLVQPEDRSHLRRLTQEASAGELTHIDQNTIELLARIFDYVFSDDSIPEEIKSLIGQLQIRL
jgi:hypothetical protein